MADRTLESLTEKQMEVLDMVLRHMSSKEIARVLGISHKSVDRRIDAARVKLGAATRQEAARIFGQVRYGESFPREALPLTPCIPAVEARDSALPTGVGDCDEPVGTPPDIASAARRRSALWLNPASIGPGRRIGLILGGALVFLLFLLSGVGIANGLQSLLTR